MCRVFFLKTINKVFEIITLQCHHINTQTTVFETVHKVLAGEQRNTFGYNCQSLQQPFAFTAHQTQPRDLFTPKSHQRTGDQVAFNINPHGQASFNHAQPEQGGQTYMEMINNN